MAGAPLLSVVVPTRDEEANVGPLLERLEVSLDAIDHEVLFVDDSDDATPAAICAAASPGGAVRLLHREPWERAGGLSTAVVTGLHQARGEFVCVMDSDLQHPPEVIPEMLAAATGGADLVVASRYTRHGSAGGLDGAGRRWVSRGASALAAALFSEARASTDPLSGFFLCRRRVVDGIEFRPVGFKILLEMLVCVPGLRVCDVPIEFAPRRMGASKASARQGLLFLNHLRSLAFEVDGAARSWKFAAVGLSGLAILLPLVAVLTAAGVSPLAAFLPAYLPSLAWNGLLNYSWTFADQRHGPGGGAIRYVERAVLSGGAMLAVYATLVTARVPAVAAAALGALAAMTVNAVTNRAAIRRRPHLWSEVAAAEGMHAAVARVARAAGATRAALLPPDGSGAADVPRGLVRRAVQARRGLLYTEAAGHRVQRRTNIDVTSTIVVPVLGGDAVAAVLLCERTAPEPFTADDLDRVLEAAGGLAGLLPTAAARGRAARTLSTGGSEA